MTYLGLPVTSRQSQLTDARQERVQVDDWLHIGEWHCETQPFLRVPGDKFLHHLLR